MKRAIPITTLFLDIGGVLLTNGWDHHARKRAATNFKLAFAEMEDRHHLTFDTYEECHVDGLRWDMIAYIKSIDGNEGNPDTDIPEGWKLMQWINVRDPTAISRQDRHRRKYEE